ncbi:MAG TPA: PAS domain S-box protein [Chitinophagales bacterium]|nr:PAS domain S-box protein [Chitinophagales bacterium]
MSISHKLYLATGTMAVLIVFELLSLWFAVTTLSSVRAFVGGEGLWSKAQKDAVYHLYKYGTGRHEADYEQYEYFLTVSAGDHQSRIEMMKPEPNVEIVREGFIRGRNHPDDVDGMIKLFTRFHRVSYIKKAIYYWAGADEQIQHLSGIAQQLHAEITSDMPSEMHIAELLKEIEVINQKVTELEDGFSYTLGEGSRWLEHLILKLLFAVALTVEITGLLLTISVSRGIQKGLDEILRASRLVAKGDFSASAAVYSGDEIGVLAQSFNHMANALDESEKQIETIFNNAPDAVIVINRTGHIIRWNPKAEEMFGWNANEVTGHFLHETIIPHKYRVAHQRGLKHYFETGEGPALNKKLELTALKKNGTEFYVELSISATTVKGDPIFIGFVSDSTEQKKAQRELQEYARRLEQSNNNLEQFAYVASHDLQEPLRTITNFTGLLSEKHHDSYDDTSKKYLTYVVSAASRMKTLISDLLAFSRIGKHLVVENVNSGEILEEVIQDMHSLIKESNATISTNSLPVVACGRTELKIVFQNLLGNALKYRKPGEQPVVTISSEKQADGYWRFSIADNGIGIEPEYYEKIFVIFQRLHNEKEYSGTGIGLATCKKIVDMAGGKIWLDSVPGKGSTFYFTIPAKP